jgi:hypothetical protein
MESEFLGHQTVALWLKNLKPALPQQHRWLEHGSFDYCLENALLKSVQLGLHGGLPQARDALDFYRMKTQRYAELPQKRRDFNAILTANLLSLAGVEDEEVRRYMLGSLDEMHRFAHAMNYDLYYNEEERQKLTGIPTCWKDRRHFIRQELFEKYGFSYPLIYDIAGLHTLYRLRDPEVDRKIDGVIRYLSTDEFHRAVADGYGILAEGNGVYHGMGWDPKYPGWFDFAGFLQTRKVRQLLFYAQYAAHYPIARETKWFRNVLQFLDAYKTEGNRYAFPAACFAQQAGYAVMGNRLSYGENRRKPNWRDIESTFYMQLLRHASLP